MKLNLMRESRTDRLWLHNRQRWFVEFLVWTIGLMGLLAWFSGLPVLWLLLLLSPGIIGVMLGQIIRSSYLKEKAENQETTVNPNV